MNERIQLTVEHTSPSGIMVSAVDRPDLVYWIGPSDFPGPVNVGENYLAKVRVEDNGKSKRVWLERVSRIEFRNGVHLYQ